MTWGQVFFYSLTLLILLEISERMGIPVSNIIGVPIYGAVRMLFRTGSYSTRKSIDMYRGMRRMRKRVKFHTPIMPQRAADVYGSSIRVKGLEVMLGYSRTGQPVKVDLDKYHTLISGTTGSGKTASVTAMLVQLFSQGSRFTKAYKVILIDLKSNPSPELEAFSPVLEYHHLGKMGDEEKVAQELINIAYHRLTSDDNRRLLVIIDEAAQVTSDLLPRKIKAMGRAALEKIASQLRTSGALILCTQYPHHAILNTIIKANCERRIVFRMRNKEMAKTALDFTPQTDISMFMEGEFLLDEPKLRGKEIVGRTFLVSVPGEIDEVLGKVVGGLAEDDVRLRTFRDHCEGLLVGSMLPGITKVANSSERTHEQLKNDRRNYANAGAVSPKTRINKTTGEVEVFGYTLACPFPEAFGKVKAYIEAGLWEDAPEKVGKNGE
jgi:hypothetical protein